MPAFSMDLFTVAASHSMSTPNASAMSTVPHRDVMARAPCLAITTPSAAATMAAAVDMLNVLRVSIPVPLFSDRGPSTLGVTLTVSIS